MVDTLIIQAFMGVLDTCKTEDDPFKMKVLEWSYKNLPLYVYAYSYDAQGQLNQQSEVGST